MKILLCLSVFHSAVLGTASPLRPAYLLRRLSYSLESPEMLLCPHAHPIPDSHHLLNLLKNHCAPTSFLSRKGITQLQQQATTKTK